MYDRVKIYIMYLHISNLKLPLEWGDRIHRDQLHQYLCLKISENPEKVSENSSAIIKKHYLHK